MEEVLHAARRVEISAVGPSDLVFDGAEVHGPCEAVSPAATRSPERPDIMDTAGTRYKVPRGGGFRAQAPKPTFPPMVPAPERTRPLVPKELVAEVARQSSRPTPPVLGTLVHALEERFGDALEAVLHYGSCLHAGDPADGVVDLFAVVRDYGRAYPGAVLRAFNRLLPPNVFYIEVGSGAGKLRAKCAVLSRADFEAGTSRWFHSYVWARFAQPCRVLHARDEATLAWVHETLARSVLTFHARVLPTMAGEEADAAGLWSKGLSLTYAAELRPEGEARAHWLVERSLPDYASLTAAAAPALAPLLQESAPGRYRVAATEAERRRCLARWRLRRWQGKLLSLLRLGKSALTFAGAADYVAFKIERHTGKAFEVTPFMRRHPFLSAPLALVKLLRRGALR